MARERRLVKPNMNNLRGKMGRSIIKTILETPKLDREKLKRLADKERARILASMEDDR
jgi:hypothetical protein